MQRTSRVELSTTARTNVSALHVLLDCQLLATTSAQYGLGCLPLALRPDLGLMISGSQAFVAADAGIILAAALVSNGDDVALRVPVETLRKRSDG